MNQTQVNCFEGSDANLCTTKCLTMLALGSKVPLNHITDPTSDELLGVILDNTIQVKNKSWLPKFDYAHTKLEVNISQADFA